MLPGDIRKKIIKKSDTISDSSKVLGTFCLSVVILIVGIFLLRNAGNANAQISSFYPASCLGGWKNTDKAVGAPDVTDGDANNYNDSNSASISNAVGQIFCGEFTGEIPIDAFQKKIILKFSWATPGEPVIAEESDAPESEENISESEEEIAPEIPEEIPITEETPEPVADEPAVMEQEVLPTEEEPAEELPASEEVSFLNKLFFSRVHAQEVDASEENSTETTEEISAENINGTTSEIPEDTTLETETTTTAALLKVLYTLDGSNWSTIGYVSDITNDVSFEMPMDIFTTITDLERVQIAIHTLPTFDDMPTIYLDSVWLEVEYESLPIEADLNEDNLNVLEEQPALALGGFTDEQTIESKDETDAIKIGNVQDKIIFQRIPDGTNILSPVSINISAAFYDLIALESREIGVPRQIIDVMNYWGIAVYTETENFISECVSTALPLPTAIFNLRAGDYKTAISLGETKESCEAFDIAEYPLFAVFETANFNIK